MEVAARAFPEREAICGAKVHGQHRLVEGAVADLIVEGCFCEVTTKLPRDKLVDSLRQLFGYVLLDWSVGYKLERAGFCFDRQGRRMSWPLGNGFRVFLVL